ncbi:methanogen output domain 1-containing protein [Methylobacterium iners]|uniref:methanogen output domain 1-containing protein n=1 Tax=Methylobacterium iners TaxID=418707 RepID=UPI001EE27309|nr:methanogen output domain 1-containing protein [Methylobacterium iners]
MLGLFVRNLSNTLEDTVGVREASVLMNLVGLAVSDDIQKEYLEAAGKNKLSRADVTQAIIDLKQRIGSDFYIIEDMEDRIIFGNRRCPYGDLAKECPTLCMMTSHMVGHLIAESQGYGRVTLAETIARGDRACRIVVNLDPDGPDDGGLSYYASGTA